MSTERDLEDAQLGDEAKLLDSDEELAEVHTTKR